MRTDFLFKVEEKQDPSHISIHSPLPGMVKVKVLTHERPTWSGSPSPGAKQPMKTKGPEQFADEAVARAPGSILTWGSQKTIAINLLKSLTYSSAEILLVAISGEAQKLCGYMYTRWRCINTTPFVV